jgi:hypothetical protein
LEKQNLGYGEMFSQAASNIPSSASNMASGLYHAVTNPVQTVSNLLDVGAGALQKALPKPVVDFVNQFESNPGHDCWAFRRMCSWCAHGA